MHKFIGSYINDLDVDVLIVNESEIVAGNLNSGLLIA
jgi:hypothetical protein